VRAEEDAAALAAAGGGGLNARDDDDDVDDDDDTASERANPMSPVSPASELRSVSGVSSVSEVSSGSGVVRRGSGAQELRSISGVSIDSGAGDADDPMGTARWVGGWHAVATRIQAGDWQGLTLVHFSPMSEPFLPLMVIQLSSKLDECESLATGPRCAPPTSSTASAAAAPPSTASARATWPSFPRSSVETNPKRTRQGGY